MKIVFIGNNRVGMEVLSWLVSEGEQICGLVVHPDDRARHKKEIVEVAGLPSEYIKEAPFLLTTGGAEWLRRMEPDLVLSVFFGYILPPEIIGIPGRGIINLHPGLLPFNKGAYSNVWSIIDETPAGATLHYIDEGIDTGDIISQQEVTVSPTDSGKTLYDRLEQACIDLFKSTWQSIRNGTAERRTQGSGGSEHRVRDVGQVDRIDPEKSYKAKDLINILRARTFPPYKGAYIEIDGKKIYLALDLVEGD